MISIFGGHAEKILVFLLVLKSPFFFYEGLLGHLPWQIGRKALPTLSKKRQSNNRLFHSFILSTGSEHRDAWNWGQRNQEIVFLTHKRNEAVNRYSQSEGWALYQRWGQSPERMKSSELIASCQQEDFAKVVMIGLCTC